jgi:hypothetical protein
MGASCSKNAAGSCRVRSGAEHGQRRCQRPGGPIAPRAQAPEGDDCHTACPTTASRSAYGSLLRPSPRGSRARRIDPAGGARQFCRLSRSSSGAGCSGGSCLVVRRVADGFPLAAGAGELGGGDVPDPGGAVAEDSELPDASAANAACSPLFRPAAKRAHPSWRAWPRRSSRSPPRSARSVTRTRHTAPAHGAPWPPPRQPAAGLSSSAPRSPGSTRTAGRVRDDPAARTRSSASRTCGSSPSPTPPEIPDHRELRIQPLSLGLQLEKRRI